MRRIKRYLLLYMSAMPDSMLSLLKRSVHTVALVVMARV